MKIYVLLLLCVASFALKAQQPAMQYFRPYSKAGLHVFETTKEDSTGFTDIKVRIGGSFTQTFQGLTQRNLSTSALDINGSNTNQLASLTNGFNLAMANLNIDAQLDDGIRMNLTLYLSSRHHPETWVKGGYIQFDKLLFLRSKAIDNIMKSVTLKIGDFEVDYGDQHFRRSDGGNSMHNPFIENLIMDQFATEIGGEIYYHSKGGFLAMVGLTNGQLNPTVIAPTRIDSATGQTNRYYPALHGKLGYDKQFNNDLRLRLTGSVYAVKSTVSNTMFSGDRTGSHYFFVMENTAATAAGNAFSGRYNPQYRQQVSAFMVNPFIKFKGIELFGTYEVAQGRVITEKSMRTAIQLACDLIYRFPSGKENFWIGGRYNTVTSTLPSNPNDITISRTAGSFGWFLTKNIMLKAEYVTQNYRNFEITDIRSGGQFSGYMFEASIGF